MGFLYQKIIKPILFAQDPERAHDIAIFSLKMLGRLGPLTRLMEFYNRTLGVPIELFGLNFPNHLGLAAGFDKNAECFNSSAALGFGHVEIGTVTFQRQHGNPKPRLFRFSEQQAIINSMGFNNDGAQAIAERLRKTASKKNKKRKIPLGINIGKSKSVSLEEAVEDYICSFNLLADYADYFTINVSSPNTPGLRALQTKEYLPTLLSAVNNVNLSRAKKMACPKIPILLKIAPDLTFPEIDFVLENMLRLNIDGIIATNTTLKRPEDFQHIHCAGGLSGAPLHIYSTEVVKYIHLSTNGKLPIIGCGGIMDAVCAGKMMDAGASLIQIYTGLIYNGPFLAKEIANALAWRQRDWL